MSKWTGSFGCIQGMTRRRFLVFSGASAGAMAMHPLEIYGQHNAEGNIDELRREFAEPPMASRPWVYWWWLEGVATKEGITADLEEMRKQGISGVLIFDAGRTGPSEVKGPRFMSEEWRENFRHAVREAARLDMEVGINLCTGWDAGGSWVEREDAIKIIVWRETQVKGPRTLTENELDRGADLQTINGPVKQTDPANWYREIEVMACPTNSNATWNKDAARVLTASKVDGIRRWEIPAGEWTILQFGYILSAKHISNPSADQLGWEIDPLSTHALDEHFKHTAALLIQDAGEHAGKTFKYTHIDSWEIGQPSWTQELAAEFKRRRGYDPIPYLPVLAGKTIESADVSKRFKYDYRRVIADLVQENYYGRLTELSHRYSMGTHSEAGGPFFNHYADGQACLSEDDIPMAEFWTSVPGYLPSVRQAASTAHIYGKKLCQAESFTGFNRDWTEDPYYLKAYGDRAFCVGLERMVIHHYASVPDFGNPPGNQWEHVSIHFNRYLTWWDKCHAWLRYLGRCQHLLRQGDFVADILFYSGEAVPNFALVDGKPVAGFDFDITNAQALLSHAFAKDGRVTFGTGTEYRFLVTLDDAGMEMSLPVLNKFRELVRAGVTLIASRPQHVPGLASYPEAEAQLQRTADELWGSDTGTKGEKKVGSGRVIWGMSTEEVIAADRLQPDLEIRGVTDKTTFDWIHRRHGSMDIYFVANSSETAMEHEFVFRVAGKVPELWNAVTGTILRIPNAREEHGRTTISMKFAPKESFFVVFSQLEQAALRTSVDAFPKLEDERTLDGPWQVHFDPAWGAPAQVTFDRLEDWTKHTDDGIRHYSGTATYQKTFSITKPMRGRSYLDLGEVKNLAQVYLNGKDLGVVWTAPWRVEITEHIRSGDNELRIDVVNLWPNRLIKDATLPKEQRLTKTNVRTYDAVLPEDVSIHRNPIDEERKRTGKPPELFPSGLVGPVTILTEVTK